MDETEERLTMFPDMTTFPSSSTFPAGEMFTVTTDEYWSIDDVPLQTYAWNVSTWGGSKQGLVRLRGVDDVIPHVPGARWNPKVPDSRTIGFEGWVLGAAPNGEPGDEQLFRLNWRALRNLFWGPGKQFEVTRRWRDESGAIRSATALGQVLDGMEPSMTGPRRGEWAVDVRLADPFFYGDWETVELTGGGNQVDVLGDAQTIDVLVEIAGPGNSMQITVVNSMGVKSFQYTTLAADASVVLDVRRMTAIEKVGFVETKQLSKVRWNGGWWLPLEPGPNSITFSRSGSPTATLKYRPVYL